ncbi:hypothetical protein CXB51_007414 [Gossypium anomalum]|uniref:CCHC-type domain-containing protein n=1 Tax=Gossypium anomalum TaxID=47600 RepID=A0A8J6D7L9_9ROSI|nr:hypothetical protein CXB51_007414 [Gossypium anomalum]
MEDSLAGLALDDEEDEIIQLEREEANQEISYANCLVGVFLTSSVVHFQAMRSTLASVWHPIGSVSISDLGRERYLFRFYYEVDVERVLKNGPWNFNSHLLILFRLQQGEDPLSVPLHWVEFWILIHDLPFGFITDAVAHQLGNFIGEFIEYDSVAVQLGYKRIMRVRVKVDVRKPLKRKKRIALRNGDSVYVRFEYEKLTLFCFLCGKLGHGESFCPVRIIQPQSEYVFKWDISLRAQSRKNQSWKSKWLVEDGGENPSNFGNTRSMGERRQVEIQTSNILIQGINGGNSQEDSVSNSVKDKGKAIVNRGPIKLGAMIHSNVEFDEDMVAHEEANSPIKHSGGLKRPRI